MDLSYYIGLETIHDVGKVNSETFWENAQLSEPMLAYDIYDQPSCYLFQIVYENKIVGEVVVSATQSLCPVISFGYRNRIMNSVKDADKIYFVENTGFIKVEDGINKFVFGENEKSSVDLDFYKTLSEKNPNDEDEIKAQWQETLICLENNTSMVGSDNKTLPSSVNISTVQDFTWNRNCGATTGAMIVDWYGRYKDPQLLRTSKPHSQDIITTLLSSTYFGSDGPTYTEWINEFEDYFDDNSSCSVSVSGVDHGNNTTTWNTYKNHVGTTYEPAVVRYVYTKSDGTKSKHAMAGVGYTGSYYRVRDTFTNDGTITDTYYYNKSSYTFSCIKVNFGYSSWRTGILKYGGSNSGLNVKRLEYMLNDLYYSPGTIDTTFTTTTRSAVIAFQTDSGLTADGIIGTNTYNALVQAHRFSLQSRVLQQDCEGDDVAELQRRLMRFRNYESGYSSIPNISIDGYFGSGTKVAVVKFQQIEGLTDDGIVGSNTYNALLN